MATLVILITYAGIGAVLQAKATAQFRLADRVLSEYEAALLVDSARASQLPLVADAILSVREGRVPAINVTGQTNVLQVDEASIELRIRPSARRGTWLVEFSTLD